MLDAYARIIWASGVLVHGTYADVSRKADQAWWASDVGQVEERKGSRLCKEAMRASKLKANQRWASPIWA